jgi:hypothetical protein
VCIRAVNRMSDRDDPEHLLGSRKCIVILERVSNIHYSGADPVFLLRGGLTRLISGYFYSGGSSRPSGQEYTEFPPTILIIFVLGHEACE